MTTAIITTVTRSSSPPLGVLPTDVVLTGDRSTGRLHLGHLAGSLQSRVALQGHCEQTLLIADLQAMTDNAKRSGRVSSFVREVALDYLTVGIDPELTGIAIQSRLPALSELTMLYLNVVTLARLERNPTVRAEMTQRGLDRDVPAGFLCYPVSQAADITGFRGTLVPVGDDQLPMLEQTNEIVRRINHLAGREVLAECRPLLSNTTRLPGIDGRKASKSFGNAIPLTASAEEIRALVMQMYTDPGHARVSDPGQVEGNVVFAYLRAFDQEREEVEDLARRYSRGGVGDVAIKRRLIGVLEGVIAPMRERRAEVERGLALVDDILEAGSRRGRDVTQDVLGDVRRVFALA